MFHRQKTQHPFPQKIAVCGATHGVGTTACAIAVTNYLCSKQRRRAAYVEFNGTHQIFTLAPKPDSPSFRHCGMDLFADVTFATLPAVMQKSFEYYILDMGVLNQNTIREFMHCDLCLILGSVCAWNSEPFGSFVEKLGKYYSEDPDRFRFLGSLGIKEHVTAFRRRYRVPVEIFPYVANPFQLSSTDWRLIEDLLKRK